MVLRTSLAPQPHLYLGDMQGRPLDAGKVYFGEPNKDPELYPINVFYDEALTIVAAQPIRTMGGFMNASGQMVEVYAAETSYSVKVLDGYGRQVFYQESMSSTSTSASVSTRLPYPGAITRMQADKNLDYISVNDFSSITDIEVALTDKRIDMLGQTIAVASLPTKNQYYNGWFSVNNQEYRSDLSQDTRISNTGVSIGANTPKPAIDYTGMVIAIGNGAMTNWSNARSCIAMGTRALNDMEAGRYNIAIGLESQFHCKSDDNGTGTGTRNVSIGDNSLRFNVLGRGNIAMGRNTAQAIENASNNTAIGSGAMAGIGSLKFKNLSDIYNQTPVKSNNAVAVGVNALTLGGDSGAVAVGAYALESGRGKTQQSTAVGFQALNILGAVEGVNGGTLVPLNTTATYVMTASNVTFNVTVANAVAGDYLYVRFDTGIPIYGSTSYRDPQYYKITAISTGSITVAEPHGVIASGNAFIDTLEDMSLVPARCDTNTAIGFQAMAEAKVGSNNNAMGYFALRKNNASGNVAIGDFSLTNLTVKRETYNTAVGYAALRTNVDGTLLTDRYNCSGLGFDTRVSADNQVQLGNSNTTTYAFGAVQDRSDARDKIVAGDITDAHIAFFNDVEFKRYRLDYRDDYIEIDDDGAVTKLKKDGSKARKREHVGVIAQQVEKAMHTHNIDFAGLQHHSKNGGDDIYTVGYQEFIPIIGEIIQRQQKQIDELLTLVTDKTS